MSPMRQTFLFSPDQTAWEQSLGKTTLVLLILNLNMRPCLSN